MIEINKYQNFKSIDKAVTKILKRNQRIINETVKQNIKMMRKKLLNRIIFFERFNFQNHYEQKKQNNCIDQTYYCNDDHNNNNDQVSMFSKI